MDSCFPAVIGNEKLKRRLALEIEEGRFPHAYILAGRDGSGKMTLAMNIAAALACKNRHTLPCGECDSCRKILGGFSPDVLILRKEEGKKEFLNIIEQVNNKARQSFKEFVSMYNSGLKRIKRPALTFVTTGAALGFIVGVLSKAFGHNTET